MNIDALPETASPASRRILACLAEPGAFARRSPLDEGSLVLFRTRRKLTLSAGQAAEAECAPLIAAGLVAWTMIGSQPHLVISAAGLAACHREPVPSHPAAGLDRSCETAAGRARQNGPAVNTRESPLAWLHRRRTKDGRPQISDIQFMAGERLRADLELGRMLPRVTANWSSPVSGASGSAAGAAMASDTALAARERVNKACAAVSPAFSGLLIDVCGFLKGLEQVEAERDWPARSAKLLLRMGLDRLALHYGMTGAPAAAAGRPRVWRGPGARPTLLPPVTPPAPGPLPGGHRP